MSASKGGDFVQIVSGGEHYAHYPTSTVNFVSYFNHKLFFISGLLFYILFRQCLVRFTLTNTSLIHIVCFNRNIGSELKQKSMVGVKHHKKVSGEGRVH